MKTNEGRVYFALDGDDFDPDEVTIFLGTKPSFTKRKGENVSNRITKESSWQLSTDNIINDYIDVFDMTKTIVDKLKPKKDLINQAIKRFNISPRLEVVLWFSMNQYCSTPAIGFEIDTVKFLAEIGAFIDIDTYQH